MVSVIWTGDKNIIRTQERRSPRHSKSKVAAPRPGAGQKKKHDAFIFLKRKYAGEVPHMDNVSFKELSLHVPRLFLLYKLMNMQRALARALKLPSSKKNVFFKRSWLRVAWRNTFDDNYGFVDMKSIIWGQDRQSRQKALRLVLLMNHLRVLFKRDLSRKPRARARSLCRSYFTKPLYRARVVGGSRRARRRATAAPECALLVVGDKRAVRVCWPEGRLNWATRAMRFSPRGRRWSRALKSWRPRFAPLIVGSFMRPPVDKWRRAFAAARRIFLPRSWDKKALRLYRRDIKRLASNHFGAGRPRKVWSVVSAYRRRKTEEEFEVGGDGDGDVFDVPSGIVAELPLLGAVEAPLGDRQRDVLAMRGPGRAAAKYRPAVYARLSDARKGENYWTDREYLEEFIRKKKEIGGARVFNFRYYRWDDRIPNKYFFFNHSYDPVYGSFILNKVINAFSRGGSKRRIRRWLYEMLSEEKSYLSPDAFYYMVHFLRPSHLNVVARRGRDVYRAPINASYTKSVMKSIKFFKKATLSRRYDKDFTWKIWNEVFEFFTWYGYANKFHEDYTALSAASKHLRHFRRVGTY